MSYNSGLNLNKPRKNNDTATYIHEDRLHHDDYDIRYRFNNGNATIKVSHKAGNSDPHTNVLDSYGQNFYVPVYLGPSAETVSRPHQNSRLSLGIKTQVAELPAYLNTSWLVGAAVRIYSDGTGAGVFFLDSDREGLTTSKYLVTGGSLSHAVSRNDSDYGLHGGLLASTTSSAPDSDLRNTVSDSDWYGAKSRLITSISQISNENNSPSERPVTFIGTKAVLLEYADYDSDFTTRNFIERDAFENAQASSGAGVSDPESWS